MQANAVARAFRLICYRDAKSNCLTGEDRICSGKSEFKSYEITLALVH